MTTAMQRCGSRSPEPGCAPAAAVRRILALDLGTRTGWALVEGVYAAQPNVPRVESGQQEFVAPRGSSPGLRYIYFNRWLEAMLAGLVPGVPVPVDRKPVVELVAYEAAHHRGGAATEVAAGFATRVQEACARHGIEHVSVHTATLKKHVTGKGNASKEEVLEAVEQRFGNETLRANAAYDEADALAVLAWALDTL